MPSKKTRTVRERVSRAQQAALRMCQKECPICLQKMCHDRTRGKKLAVEINCGCKVDDTPSVWHAKCFRQRKNQENEIEKPRIGPTGGSHN